MQTDPPQTTTSEVNLDEYRTPAPETSQPDDASTPTVEVQEVSPIKIRTTVAPLTISVKINVIRETTRQEIRRFNSTNPTCD